MSTLDTSSLVNTLDNVNSSLLSGNIIKSETGLEVARWIATRQGQTGSYRGMFAPTPNDFKVGIHVFTGEKLIAASARHIMGEEAARAIWLFGRQDPVIMSVYNRAIAWMHPPSISAQNGFFCCGRCALGLWRHYWVGDFNDKEELISNGLRVMKEHRIGSGKWNRFPFHYAIFTLMDLDLKPAREELMYAQPQMERVMKSSRSGVYPMRRRVILEKALARL